MTTDPKIADIEARIKRDMWFYTVKASDDILYLLAENERLTTSCAKWMNAFADMSAARDTLKAKVAELEKEAQAAFDMAAAHEEKWKSLTAHDTCGCSYDHKDDVCMHHSPKLIEARAAVKVLVEQLCYIANNIWPGDDVKKVIKSIGEIAETAMNHPSVIAALKNAEEK